jgi:outer membrane protein
MNVFLRLLFVQIAALLLISCAARVPSERIETRPVDMSAPPTKIKQPTIGGTDPGTDLFPESEKEKPLFGKPRSALPELPAEGILDLTLERAVVTALARNRSLRVEQFEPVIAGTFVEQEVAQFDPVLFASGSYESYRDRSLDDVAARFFSIDGSRTNLQGGVRQSFLTGTDMSLDLSLTNREDDRTDFSEEARAGLNLTQALLRDRGVAANIVAIRQAETSELASVYRLRGFTENLVAEVENTFWDYALAIRRVEIFEESFALAKKQLANIETRIEVGQLAETEKTVGDAELALREQQLINARNDRERARLTLLRLLNPPTADGWDRQITLSEKTIIPKVTLGSPEEHEALAVRLRPDLNEARLQARRGELETVQTANGLLPRLDLFMILGKTGYSQSFSSSFEDLDGPGYDFTIGLDYEFPLYNREAAARDRRAQATFEQALESIENLRQLIALDIRNALLEVERSLQQITASASRRTLQEEVARAENIRFQVGSVTALDVARVQRDLLESRINEVEAIVNYRKSLIDLYRLDGTLLLRRGIQGPGAEEVVLQPQNDETAAR